MIHRNNVPILYHFQDMASYLSKVANFSYPALFHYLVLPLWVASIGILSRSLASEICPLGILQLGLCDDVLPCNAVLMQYMLWLYVCVGPLVCVFMSVRSWCSIRSAKHVSCKQCLNWYLAVHSVLLFTTKLNHYTLLKVNEHFLLICVVNKWSYWMLLL